MNTDKQTIALITGASDGIGKEAARQLAVKGIHVILGSRNIAKGEGVVKEFKEAGLEVDVVQLDICDESSVATAAIEIENRYGRLDILINNAGMALDRGPLSELAVEDLSATLNTNVVGTFRATKAFLPLLKKSAHGRIVNVSSGLGSLLHITDPESPYSAIALPSYAASKAALNVLTLFFARELEGSTVKINAVCPGLTATRYVQVPGAQPVEVGAATPVKYALIDDDGPHGGFFDRHGPHKW